MQKKLIYIYKNTKLIKEIDKTNFFNEDVNKLTTKVSKEENLKVGEDAKKVLKNENTKI